MKLYLSATVIAAFAGSASATMIINGSFEDNVAGVTTYNMNNATANATINNITSFAYSGVGELDIMTFGGGYGLDPVDGDWHLGMSAQAGLGYDQFSFDLNTSIVSGMAYDLSFWAAQNTSFSLGEDVLEIGVSNSATSFGTLIWSSGDLPDDMWMNVMTDFIAPIDGDYLTLRLVDDDPLDAMWVHLDAFTLSAVPSPGALVIFGIAGAMCGRRRRA